MKTRKYSLCGKLVAEFRELLIIAIPYTVENCLDYSLWIVNLIMLGHLGKGNLAAGSLSICYLNMVWFFIQGSISSQSRALLRASEELDKLEIRVICYSLLIQSFLLSILATGIMVVSPFVLPIIIPQNHNVAFKACQQLYFFIPVLWCMVVFRITQICLRYHNIWRHTLLSLLIGNILNIIGRNMLAAFNCLVECFLTILLFFGYFLILFLSVYQ